MSIHASCVEIAGRGVLLLGGSGSGKSDLALRLIDGGATLVADDQVELSYEGGQLWASAPARLAGLIEARGVGILTLPHKERSPLALAVQLVERAQVERLPEAQFFDCEKASLPLLSLHAFDGSTAAKIRLYLMQETS